MSPEDIERRNALTLEKIGLAHAIAYDAYARGWGRRLGTREDIEQEAVLCLINALEKCDMSDPRWKSYLARGIKMYLIQSACRSAHPVCFPSHLLSQNRAAKRSKSTKLLMEGVLNEAVGVSGDSAGSDAELWAPRSHEPDPAEEASWKELLVLSQHSLDLLSEKQQEVIRYYFGIGCDEPLSLRQIAIIYGVSHQTVSNWIDNCLATLAKLVK